VWYLLFGFAWGSAPGYAWLSIVAGVLASLVSVLFAVRGDRGVAVGIALVSGFSLAAVGMVLIVYWINGNWLLW
jgi:hypothetical protein